MRGALNPKLSAFERHKLIIEAYQSQHSNEQGGTAAERELLVAHHKFVREGEEDLGGETWQERMAIKYFNRLHKEYALADLSHYREGRVGLRWRTEPEVLAGKGQYICGNKTCKETTELSSYELNFKYIESGEAKNELVKVRACPQCARKLHYKKGQKEESIGAHDEKAPNIAGATQTESRRHQRGKNGEDGEGKHNDERELSVQKQGHNRQVTQASTDGDNQREHKKEQEARREKELRVELKRKARGKEGGGRAEQVGVKRWRDEGGRRRDEGEQRRVERDRRRYEADQRRDEGERRRDESDQRRDERERRRGESDRRREGRGRNQSSDRDKRSSNDNRSRSKNRDDKRKQEEERLFESLFP